VHHGVNDTGDACIADVIDIGEAFITYMYEQHQRSCVSLPAGINDIDEAQPSVAEPCHFA
jgi:hypothetical protein